jgi:hypothetical protein
MPRACTKLPKGAPPLWRTSTEGDQIVVWLKSVPPKRIGAVNRRLAADARRYGQDLVQHLIDKGLHEADRQGRCCNS